MNFMQILIMVFSSIMLLWFVAPIAIWRILNIGNILGIFGCVGLITATVFWQYLSRLLLTFWSSVFGKVSISVIGIVLTASLLFAGTMSVLMIKSTFNAPVNNATAVVLGCRVYGTKPSLMLVHRMDTAIDYLKANPQANAVLSGGRGGGEDISEAQAMFAYITSKGIDKDRLFLEDKSTDTDENISFSQKVIVKENLSKNIAIVSQEFHLFRANIIAKKNKISPSSLPAKTNIILLPTYWVREIVALAEETILKQFLS